MALSRKKTQSQPRAKPAQVTEIVPATSKLIEEMEPDESHFLELYLTNGNNAAQAATEVWPHLTYGSARVTASRVLARAQGYIVAYMDDKGLTLEKLLSVVADGLTATVPVITKTVVYKDGKRTKETQHIEYANDFGTRHRYAETALKLRGALASKPAEIIVVGGGTVNTQNNMNVIMDNQGMVKDFAEFYMEKQREKLTEKRKERLLTSVNKSEATA